MASPKFFNIPARSVSIGNQPEFLPKSRIIIFIFALLMLTIFIASRFIWKPSLEVSQIAPRNFYANQNFRLEDEEATQKLINQTIQNIKPSLKKDVEVTEQLKENMDEFLYILNGLRAQLQNQPYLATSILSKETQDYIFNLNLRNWKLKFLSPVKDITCQLLAGGIPSDNNKSSLILLINNLIPKNINNNEQEAIRQVILASFFPDTYLSQKATSSNNHIDKEIREDILQIYKNYKTKGYSNLNKVNTKLSYPDNNRIKSIINVTAYILRISQEARSVRAVTNLVLQNYPIFLRRELKKINNQRWMEVDHSTRDTFNKMLDAGLDQTDMEKMDELTDKYLPNNYTDDERKLISIIIKQVARPNIIIDQKQLLSLQEEAVKNIKPVYITVNKGTLLVKEGQIITQEKFRILDASGALSKEINWSSVSDIFSLITISIFIFILYCYFFQRDVLNNVTNLWLISILAVATTGISLFIYSSYPGMVPLAVFAGIIAMFINRQLAFICLLILGILYQKVFYLDIPTSITLIIGSIAAVFLLSRITQRILILKYGIVIATVQVISFNLTTILMDLSQKTHVFSFNEGIITDSFMWFLSGIIFSMLILSLQPLIEESFGLITFSRLTELADFNQPLLLELNDRAPGTFQHSLAVSTLSEFAARKLNLDSTYCRVGAYYHDLGKMFKPEYFIENQFNDENLHDKLNDPYKSAKIIISHARAGLVIARKNKLPQALVPFIIEHHGTSLVSYFYFKAQEAAGNIPLDESQFRYFGPKPQSKETAITMLADSAEAAVRASKDKTQDNIKSIIKSIVADKINDGQLNESGLTTDEIAIIIESFTHVVIELHHQRIEYPAFMRKS